MGRALYVYGIVRAIESLRFDVTGIDPRGAVHVVRHERLAAVVSPVPYAAVEPTRANLLAHERVNAAVLREHTVLPMSFGMVFRSREDVVALLRSARRQFSDVLGQMDDRVEFGLTVYRKSDAPERGAQPCADEFLRRLRDVCVASRCSPPEGERMLMDAAFLVQRRDEPAFDARVQAIAGEFDALTFRYSGPWPPYNFVAIRIRREEAEGAA